MGLIISGGSGAPANGSVTQQKLSALARSGGWLPTGAIAQSVSRSTVTQTFTTASGTLYLIGGIVVPAGQAVSSISFSSNAAANGPTAQWFAIYSTARSLLATTVDDGSTAWAANTIKTLQIATALRGATPGGTWTPGVDTEVYIAVCQNASSATATLRGAQTLGLSTPTPLLMASSDTGLSAGVANAPTTAAALTVINNQFYCYVS